jgi:hypothetical protein
MNDVVLGVKVTPENLITLQCALRLLETKGWTRAAYARDVLGRAISPYDDGAACYCLAGAIYAASPTGSIDTVALAVLDKLLPKTTTLARFNDSTTRTSSQVTDLLRSAIDLFTQGN